MTTTQMQNGKSSGKAKKGSRRNEIGGFLVDKLSGATMRAFIKENKVDVDTAVDDEQLAVALTVHFKKTTAAEDLVRCAEEDGGCGAVSDGTLEACPFCGDAGEVEDLLGASAADEPDADEDEDEDEDEARDEDDEEDESPAEEAMATSEPMLPPPVSEPAPKKAKAPAAKKEKAAKAVAPTPLALVKPASTDVEVITQQTLDKNVADVHALAKKVNDATHDAAEAYWQLGQKLLEINASQSWKLRDDGKGKQTYRSWDQFVNAELNMSIGQAYAAIEVAREYDSSKIVREIGQTKAALLLKAAPQDRPMLEEEAKAGASVRALKKGVNESRKKHGAPKTSQQAKAGATGAAAKATKKGSSEKVSMAMLEGTVTVKLYKKPESMRNIVWPPEKRAKRLGDLPFGRHEMANGLVQNIAVLEDKNGDLVVKIQTVREEA